jgi:glucose-1-phosphate cytidylyltransferase
MKAVILAGGLGTRIGSVYGADENRPKPMVQIGRRPIIWHIMKIYAHHGITDFIVALGHMGYVIKEYFANYVLHHSDLTIDMAEKVFTFHSSDAEPWKVTLAETGDQTMTGGRLKRVAQYLDPGESFCLTYGDGLSDVNIADLVDFHKQQGRSATVTVVRPTGRFGATILDGSKVAQFNEKPAGDGGQINGGFFVLEPSVLDLISGDDAVWERKPLEELAARNELSAFQHNGFWQPMDTLRDKVLLEELWQTGAAPWKVWAD